MRYFIQKFIILLLLSGSIFDAQSQTIEVVRSNEKVVVAGKFYYLHIVREKQTMFSICKAYGVDIKEVMRINRKKTHSIDLNEILRIPFEQSAIVNSSVNIQEKEASDYFYHVIQKGNTLYSLSKKFNQSIDNIKVNNPEIGENGKLTVGTVLKIQKQTYPQQEDKKKNTYKVKANDSEADILDKFNIKRKTFRKLNPHVKSFRNITAGTIVNLPKNVKQIIPVEELTEETIENLEQKTDYNQIFKDYSRDTTVQSKINIALFLPLYAALNDSLNWEITYQDTLKVMTRKQPETVYPKSRDFIRLYQGVLLAVEDLKKQGLEINLHVFDTEKKQSTVRKTLEKLAPLKIDIILGPVYSNTFEIVAEYAQAHQIPIVSPLSSKNDQLHNNPFVFQINTSVQSLCDNIFNHLMSDKENKNIVIVHSKNYKELEEYKLVSDIEQQLFENGTYWQYSNLNYSKISFEDYGNLGLEYLLSKTLENIIVIPSSNPAVVESFLTNLKILSKEYPIQLIGFPSWQRYSSMDPSNLFELNTLILSPYFIDYESEKVGHFVDRFRYEFNCEPNDYTFRAYDLTLYFSTAIKRYGTRFFDHLSEIRDIDLLQSNYAIESVNAWGGFENRGLKMINYSTDFIIKSQNFKPTIKMHQVIDIPKEIINQ
ncbi:LysM peptidoglycan-binding domain-containing protein [Ancylomarina euxinus]|uniref:LysM peptidoglycan-binding domain-containing protein n=1 Tax=Ancylomarina euxinus TaxID=2283627 RepID=A0A425Y1R8_9BACT|nr:LysM peptidoglycan-binding domain-containing protein [Ancylomarina euxinus]MCZ4695126.1 ABC transporter substrate-binding protein [Ancylomarina euxinus]MUP14938.1 ABC transporter substrate-binding protein [Ancylomarina euxinus]RRG21832.1 LysM peptidoglycan-binding domain-containing protein [Ancylomarina euxinus]